MRSGRGVETEPAESPTDLSAGGWKDVARRVVAEVKRDHIPLNAAGVAFFGFLSTIPAMVALVSLYGLIADPDAIEERVNDIGGALPDEARQLVIQQLEGIVAVGGGTLGLSFAISLAIALWSASTALSYLIEAVNIAYDREETRGFVVRRALSIAFTFGALIFVAVVIGVITALPAVLAATGLPAGVRWLISLGVWPLVGIGLSIGLAILYRYGPDREPEANWRWVTPGSTFAVVAWLIASIGFQVYAANFGSYNETYGSLGAVVVLLIWLWISSLVILVGAEINNETERQTSVDTSR